MLTKKDSKAINSLLRYAKNVLQNHPEFVPRRMHFALAVNKKKYVYGHNSYNQKKEFQENHKHLTPHAESFVLKHLNEIRALYVIRINSEGDFLLSKPCLECYKLIKDKKVKSLIFSVYKGIKKISL